MSDKTKNAKGLGTLAVHAGWKRDEATTSHAVPLYQTSAYEFNSAEHAAELFKLNVPGNIYTRLQNPTTAILEQRMAALDGGIGALAFSSGQQTALATLASLAAGKHVVAASALYGGTVTLLTQMLPKLGIEVTMVDLTDPENLKSAIRDDTRAVMFESLANPRNDVLRYEKLVEIAHAANVPVICDNTVLTPILFRPFDYGIDFAMYSTTKFINGHGNSIGGVIVDSGKFDWTSQPDRWPQFTAPDPAYHGLVYHEKFGQACFLAAGCARWLRDLGGTISPFNSYLTLIGLQTLQIRMQRHCENAMALARFLESHPLVEWVNYPGLESHPNHELAKHYLKHGFGAMIGFGVKGERDNARRFIEAVEIASHVTNLGDVKTIVTHPASTTHSQLSAKELQAGGISETSIRISTGIEDIDDLTADFDRALRASAGA